jgi:DNA-binding beta-propeller fold protein YncE
VCTDLDGGGQGDQTDWGTGKPIPCTVGDPILDVNGDVVTAPDTSDDTMMTVLGNGIKGYSGDGDLGYLAGINLPNGSNPEPAGAMAFTDDEKTMYFADTLDNCIRQLDIDSGIVTLLAGSCDVIGDDAVGSLTDARFDYPTDLALDSSTNQLFVADANNHEIKVININEGTVEVFAGTGEPSCPDVTVLTTPQYCAEQHTGGDGGPATEATLYRPFGIALDGDGNLVIADTYDHRFRIVYRN